MTRSRMTVRIAASAALACGPLLGIAGTALACEQPAGDHASTASPATKPGSRGDHVAPKGDAKDTDAKDTKDHGSKGDHGKGDHGKGDHGKGHDGKGDHGKGDCTEPTPAPQPETPVTPQAPEPTPAPQPETPVTPQAPEPTEKPTTPVVTTPVVTTPVVDKPVVHKPVVHQPVVVTPQGTSVTVTVSTSTSSTTAAPAASATTTAMPVFDAGVSGESSDQLGSALALAGLVGAIALVPVVRRRTDS